jgi:hypothetical protein
MAALLIVLAVVGLAEVLIYRFGRDSRDGDDWLLHDGWQHGINAH